MTHGSLFSGIGGFDLAAEWMGWKNIFHCEIDVKARKVLQRRFPGVRSIHDVRDIYRFAVEYMMDEDTAWCNRHNMDFADCDCIGCSEWDDEIGSVDVLTAGFPCQPYSNNGKRKGAQDERNLWPETIRIVRSIQPSWFIGENVPGLASWEDGKYLSTIVSDLIKEGYEVWPILIPASSVNAEHKRERIWIVANNPSIRIQRMRPTRKQISQPLDIEILPLRNSNGEWKVEPDLRRANDGVSRGMDRLKLIGNAIVPQIAYQIFKAIEEYANTTRNRC